MPPLIKKVQIGETVAYVKNTDVSPDQESPNIDPAIITQVYKDGIVDLFVMHSNGSYNIQRVGHGGPKERGTWHFIRLGSGQNG